MKQKNKIYAFTLVEVVIALMILGISISVILGAFTQSIKSAKRNKIRIMAVTLAEKKLQEFELNNEIIKDDEYEGDFGADYENYSWEANLDTEDVEYKNTTKDIDEEKYTQIRALNLKIFYADENYNFTALSIDTYLLGTEKFTFESKDFGQIF